MDWSAADVKRDLADYELIGWCWQKFWGRQAMIWMLKAMICRNCI